MLQKNFTDFNPHLEGSRIELSTTESKIATVGSDDIIFMIDYTLDQTHSLELKNSDKLDITAFVMHPHMPNHFVFGASDGIVKFLRPANCLQLQTAEILYKGNKPISSLAFSESGKYLGIGTEESWAVIYNMKSRKLCKLPSQHEGLVNRVHFCGDEYVFSIGSEGNLLLYSIQTLNSQEKDEEISDDPFEDMAEEICFSLIDSYKIASEAIAKKFPFLNAVYAEMQHRGSSLQAILTAGQEFLQTIKLQKGETKYQLERGIQQQKELLQIQLLGKGQNGKGITLVATTQQVLSIWNYSKLQRITVINIYSELKSVVSALLPFSWKEAPSFAFLTNNPDSDSKLYVFNNQSLLDVEDNKSQPKEQEQEIQQEKNIQEDEEESRQQVVSFAGRLIPEYPQFPLEKGYEEYQRARFLFYNSVGCVIQRSDDLSETALELELHDKSKPKKFKIDFKNRSFGFFGLKEKAFLCATSNLIVFQEEKQLKEGFQGWELAWENIQGVAMGGSWIAASNPDQIRIFDYAGNELQCICFDRRFITMEAYEDLLAVVYHSSLPMWGCQSIKMRIYKITPFSVTVDRDVLLPIKPNSILKWFGFSEEGMILCQDSLQAVRCYSFLRDQWHIIFSLEGKQECLFIQHVQGLDLYGFRLEHRPFEKEEPKVLPRSLPRKIPMEWPYFALQFFSREENSYLRKIMLRNMMIEHQQYRRQAWYKLKYSRKRDHPWFEQSKSIKSEEEIKTLKTQSDMQLYDYLKKYLSRTELQAEKRTKMVLSLSLICERESHFQQTREKLRQMLTNVQERKVFLPSYSSDLSFGCVVQPPRCKQKLNEISILEQMLNLMQYSC